MAAVAVLLTLRAFGGELFPESFTCTGEASAGLCWLSDVRLYATATWRFTGVSGGNWTLVLEGVAADPCADCELGRDLYVRVYYSEGIPPWQWQDVLLRNVDLAGPNGYTVRAEIPIQVRGPDLSVMVKRLVLCDPRVGFTGASARLVLPAVPVVEPPPPPPPPVVEPSPPPVVEPPPPEVCLIGMTFSCAPADLAASCAPDLDLEAVARDPLPETFGPGADVVLLGPGHYSGEFLGPTDFQDWYRIRVEFTEAAVVYLRTISPNLVVDVYLVHDPCGTDLAVCRDVQGATALAVPCHEEHRCETIPSEGEGVCFRSGACNLYVRIVRKAGEGPYLLSVLPAGFLAR
ncbi:hypothetical protein H5T53_00910 [Candidatus Bipolaricaulota bacterium]|nr:hypothetical protein [Candidatus Bipolaricaulota bacterium]